MPSLFTLYQRLRLLFSIFRNVITVSNVQMFKSWAQWKRKSEYEWKTVPRKLSQRGKAQPTSTQTWSNERFFARLLGRASAWGYDFILSTFKINKSVSRTFNDLLFWINNENKCWRKFKQGSMFNNQSGGCYYSEDFVQNMELPVYL